MFWTMPCRFLVRRDDPHARAVSPGSLLHSRQPCTCKLPCRDELDGSRRDGQVGVPPMSDRPLVRLALLNAVEGAQQGGRAHDRAALLVAQGHALVRVVVAARHNLRRGLVPDRQQKLRDTLHEPLNLALKNAEPRARISRWQAKVRPSCEISSVSVSSPSSRIIVTWF